jgi:Tfp pilus assembly protein PilF
MDRFDPKRRKNIRFTTYVIVISFLFLISSCATIVPERSVPPPTPQVSIPPPDRSIAPTPKSQAAASLHDKARNYLAKGHYSQAELTIERALRIDPRNAGIWYTLAQTKYLQKEYSKTINMCLKSKSLIIKNDRLQKMNNDLISQAQMNLD